MFPRILYVCTANQCRSPLAEALTMRRAPEGVVVASAGLLEGGRPVPSSARRAGAALGLDLTSHRSRKLSRADLEAADVVLCMTRAHVRDIVAEWPGSWPQVATVKQVARWLETDPISPGSDFRQWLHDRTGDRPRSDLIGDSVSDDIVDPMGRSVWVWRRSTREIAAAVAVICAALAQ